MFEQYLKLDPEIETAIADDLACGRKHPLCFHDEDIERRHPFEHDEATVARPAFSRDVEKIINLPAYARYAGKTQVFSFTENDDISRRGLHVQLVSRIARNIGRMLGLNTDLIEAISLGHDVGHTPFGHAGERFLSASYHRRTGRYFNHNVHSVRVLDQLFRRNISLQTLDGVLCHNGEFAHQELKLGDIDSFEKLDETVDRCIADEQAIATLRPSTLEACVVRVSDMIAYLGKDRQDAYAMGVIDSFDSFSFNRLGCTNNHIINNLTVDIVNNSYGQDSIKMSPDIFQDVKTAKRENYDIIYHREGMVDDTVNVVEEMFEQLYERLRDDVVERRGNSPVVLHHVKNLCMISRSIDAEQYLSGDPDQVVVDYMASMTDNYFMALYRHLFPCDQRTVFERTYCSDLG